MNFVNLHQDISRCYMCLCLFLRTIAFSCFFDRSTASNNQAATLRGTIAGEAVFSDVEGESCWIIVNMRYECSLTNLDKLRCTKSVCIRKTHALSKLPLGAKHLKLWTTMPRCQGISWCTCLILQTLCHSARIPLRITDVTDLVLRASWGDSNQLMALSRTFQALSNHINHLRSFLTAFIAVLAAKSSGRMLFVSFC